MREAVFVYIGIAMVGFCDAAQGFFKCRGKGCASYGGIVSRGVAYSAGGAVAVYVPSCGFRWIVDAGCVCDFQFNSPPFLV